MLLPDIGYLILPEELRENLRKYTSPFTAEKAAVQEDQVFSLKQPEELNLLAMRFPFLRLTCYWA